MDLLVAGHDGAVGPEGHDLVAERRGGRGLGHPDHQGGVQASGPGRPARPRSASRSGACRGTPRPPARAPARARVPPSARSMSRVAGNWAASTTAGSICDLREAAHPAALDGGGCDRAHRRAAVGGVVGRGRDADHADQGDGAGDEPAVARHGPARAARRPDGHPVDRRIGRPWSRPSGSTRAKARARMPSRPRPSRGFGQRAEAHPADVDGGGQAERAAEAGHPEDRSAGLAEEDPADGQAAERPAPAGPPRPGSWPPGKARARASHRTGGDGQAGHGR